MPEREKVIKGLENCFIHKGHCHECPYNSPNCENDVLNDAIAMLKQEAVVRCKDCKNWIPGYITDQDDFIPPKCGKYQQMVGHSNDDFCSLAEKKNQRIKG